MWNRIRHFNLLLLVVLLLGVRPGGAAETEDRRHWSGQIRLAEPVTVASGAVLTIAPGTRIEVAVPTAKLTVRGTLLIKGSAAAPVVFESPPGWEGVVFMEAPAHSEIRWARFQGAKMAISSFATDFTVANSRFVDCEFAIKLLRESAPAISDSEFIDNRVGIDNEMKSAPTVRNSLFRGHSQTAILASHGSKGEVSGNRFEANKQAIALLQRYPDRIADNRFIDNETGIYCNQTQNTPLIEGNHFEGNRLALVNFSFAYPALRNNRFIANEVAIRNDQYGSPLVEHNLFRENGTALYNYRKSNPKVHRNRFEANDLAVFCDFSSYPEIEQNNFVDNAMGVKLGIYQSADWERRSGSRTIMQREAQSRQSQNPLLAKAPTEFNDVVDVSGNWWGDQSDLLAAAGEEGNVRIFHDRRDQPTVTYEGYGSASYRLDRIKFTPWLDEPVEGAGPQEEP